MQIASVVCNLRGAMRGKTLRGPYKLARGLRQALHAIWQGGQHEGRYSLRRLGVTATTDDACDQQASVAGL